MLGELLTLLFRPIALLFRLFTGRRRAGAEEIRRFYRSPEWKRLRFNHLQKEPACRTCGASAARGARMNVDHIRPLHRFWHLRLAPWNLQTLCAACNWGKGGQTIKAKKRRIG